MRRRSHLRSHLALGTAQLGAWGALYYTWPLIVVPMAEETGWGSLTLSAAFSGGLLLGGLVAPWLGRRIDRRGGRTVMVGGGLLAVVGLVVWAGVRTPAAYVAVQLALGVAGAATLYDAAFATLGRLHRSPATVFLGIWRVSLVGAVAGPVTAVGVGALVVGLGWRGALLGVALATLLIVVLPVGCLVPVGRREGGAGPVGANRHDGRGGGSTGSAWPSPSRPSGPPPSRHRWSPSCSRGVGSGTSPPPRSPWRPG